MLYVEVDKYNIENNDVDGKALNFFNMDSDNVH